MVRLLSVLKGEAKRLIGSIGTSGLFYKTTLKSLKRDFGDQLVVSDFKMKLILDKLQIKGSDRSALRQFQQELKSNNSWLTSMGCHSTLASSKHVTKAVQRIPLTQTTV